MIYLTIKTFLDKTKKVDSVNTFLDYLEMELKLDQKKVQWNPNKTIIKIIVDENDQLIDIEKKLKTHFDTEIEWEVYDEKIQSRYIAQLLIRGSGKQVLNYYLLVLFPEDYVWDI